MNLVKLIGILIVVGLILISIWSINYLVMVSAVVLASRWF